MTIVPQAPPRSTPPPEDQHEGVGNEAFDGIVRSPSGTEQALVGTVQDLIALGLLAMQFHWYPGRSSVRAVHELLDDLADRALQAADNVAERVAAVGRRPTGRPDRSAHENTVADLGEVAHLDRGAITTFEGILQILAAELHQTLGEVSGEPLIHQLLAGIAVEVDKHASTIQEMR